MSAAAPPAPTNSRPTSLKQALRRSWTRMSSDTTETEADRNARAGAIPAFVGIFQEAAKYGDILTEEPDAISGDESERSSLSESSGESTDTADTAVDAQLPTAQPLDADERRMEEIMDNLMLQDKFKERFATKRLCGLGVNAFTATEKTLEGIGGDTRPAAEPTPEQNAEELKALGDRIIPLLVQEFGDITEIGEEEKLIVESDGAYFQDIAILGIIHLTTHRVTFHASLLSTRPDLMHQHQVLKSGPVIIHRPGWHRKRRVWLELAHDMVSSFPGSTEEERVRPIRSIMLSDIKEIKPLDTSEPKCLRIVIKTENGLRNGFFEVDTIESASDWRRALTGAVHEFRQRRSKLFRGEGDSDSTSSSGGNQSGVRIAVPLHRIDRFDSRSWGTFAHVVTLYLTGEHSTPSETVQPYTSITEDPYDTMQHLREQVHAPGNANRTLTMTVIQGFNAQRLMGAIQAAKKRRLENPATSDEGDQVVVDFGELAMMDPMDGSDIPVAITSKDIGSITKRVFAIPEEEEVWHVRAALGIFSSCAGYLVVHKRYICFWAKALVTETRLRFHAHDINGAFVRTDEKKCIKKFHRMVLQVKGHKDLVFSFKSNELRVEAMDRINLMAKEAKERLAAGTTPASSVNASSTALGDLVATSAVTAAATLVSPPPTPSATAELASTELILERSQKRIIPTSLLPHIPRPINIPAGSKYHILPQHFGCLTIGSRGDVQPYIALCLGLKKEGHQVTIITHEEYKPWVEAFGIQHRTAGGDPGALMKLSVEHKMFSPQFFKESLGNFRKWLDELLVDSYEQVKASGATVLIESPSAMAGVHIAEALKIPYFRAFTMPWSRTAEYPHAFISPPDFVAGSFNYSTYVLFDNVFWKATSLQINPWRKKHLGLPATDLEHLAQTKIPFLYNFSPHVVPKPLDWSDTTIITGYWFLDNPDVGWKPSQTLLDFMAKARADGKPLVYIGFGSIVVENPKAMTRSIVKAVLKADVRAILNKGWSARMSTSSGASDATPEVEIPPEVYELDKVPHDWLFPQIDAAMHHGGAGTTGASLRAGIPTLIKPWFGDQFFWAARVQKLGAGLKVPSLSSSEIAHALVKATSDRVIREKAQAVGEKIRQEDGVGTAISSLYTYLHRAGMRMPHHHVHHAPSAASSESHRLSVTVTRKTVSNSKELEAMVDALPAWSDAEAHGGGGSIKPAATIP